MVFHGFWLVPMVFQGGFMVFQGGFMVSHGFWLVPMVFQGVFFFFWLRHLAKHRHEDEDDNVCLHGDLL